MQLTPSDGQLKHDRIKPTHLASVVDDAEIGLILQLLGLKELGVTALLLADLLHKALVGGFREPALLVKESQDTRRTGLHRPETQIFRS